jgi:hypothetical protein
MYNRFASRGLWCRGAGIAAVLLGALLLPSCNDRVTNITGVTRSIIEISVEPNPVPGVQNPLTGSVSAAYVVKIAERAGLGGELQFVSGTIFDPETGLQTALNYFDSADLIVFVGSSRVDAGGELDVPQTLNYTLDDFRVDANLTVNIQFLDDLGSVINRSILVPVVPAPAE